MIISNRPRHLPERPIDRVYDAINVRAECAEPGHCADECEAKFRRAMIEARHIQALRSPRSLAEFQAACLHDDLGGDAA